MKKIIAKTLLVAMTVTPLTGFLPAIATAVAPMWDTTGNYVINMNYLGTDYPHDMTLTQDNSGNLTGSGGSPAGSNTYTWTITSGSVSANTIDFYANYTATPDAVTPQTTMHVMGTIAGDGTMSGTWSDNYQGGARTGTWTTASGHAEEIDEEDDETPNTVNVIIMKYIDGEMATANSAQSMGFPMSSSWDADNLGSGTGTYTLGTSGFNSPDAYTAMTAEMSKGADYTTHEVTGGSVVGASCETGQPYRLAGYTTGHNINQAENATPSMNAPSFTNLHNDRIIIVWNESCDGSNEGGGLGGEVTQGNGVLHVDSITVQQGTGTANGTFASGWKYVFHITAPTNEPNLAMKFADWLSGSNVIPVANNMRISSAQATNGGVPIVLTAANVYSSPPLVMTGDLDSGTAGRQVEVLVEVAIPTGTPAGSYTTTYGVKTTP